MRAILFVLAMLCSFAVSAACDFPASLSAFTNPTAGPSGTALSTGAGGLSHAQMHGAKFDCIEAMQAKIGIDGSLDTDSFDYRIEALEDLFPSDILPLANGGTGSTLSDPGADRLLFWDDSAGAVTWLTAGSGLSISGTTITASGGGGGGSGTVTNTGTLTADKLVIGNGGSDIEALSSAGIDTYVLHDSPTGPPFFGLVSLTDSVDGELPIANGGTGGGDAPTARENLGIDFVGDATGDILYRDSGGDLARLPIGSSGQVLTVATGLPSWATASGGGAVVVSKPSNTTRTSTTTFAADPDLQFAIAANQTCSVTVVINFYTNATPDIKFSNTGPASPAFYYSKLRFSSPGSTSDNIDVRNAFGVQLQLISSSTGYGIIEYETLVQNGANAGTFAIEWAQNTSNAADTIVLGGSYLVYRCS